MIYGSLKFGTKLVSRGIHSLSCLTIDVIPGTREGDRAPGIEGPLVSPPYSRGLSATGTFNSFAAGTHLLSPTSLLSGPE